MKVVTITARYIRICWPISATSKHRREKLSCYNSVGFLSRNQTQLNLKKAFCQESKCFLFATAPVVWCKMSPLPCYRTIGRANSAVRKEFLGLQATERKYKRGNSKNKSAQQSYVLSIASCNIFFSPSGLYFSRLYWHFMLVIMNIILTVTNINGHIQ